MRMDALCKARGLLDPLACSPRVLTVRFLARAGRRVFSVPEQEFRLVGPGSEMLPQQFRENWMQRDRDLLPALDDGFDLHSFEIEIGYPQPVELRPPASVEQRHQEGIVLGGNSSKTISDEHLCLRGLENPSEDVGAEGSPSHRLRFARHSDGFELREHLEKLRVLSGLSFQAVESDQVTQVSANGRPSYSGLGQVGLVGGELLPAPGVQVQIELFAEEPTVPNKDPPSLVK